MSDTFRFSLPLLDAAQAQKHVTINEALVRADILGARRIESRSFSTPPVSPVDGTAYVVGPSPSGDWASEENNIALFLNGGWVFVTPWSGARFWVEDQGNDAVFQGGTWHSASISLGSEGASTAANIIEFDHDLAASTVSTTTAVIPDKAIVLGVTGRVVAAITGAGSWSLGVAGSPDRYGSGIGKDLGSFAHGVTGQPQAYFGPTSLEITSDGPAFTGGTIRLAVHLFSLTPPAAI